jgi:CRISPR/Cas system-associated exonuclease Cas4 (RecB family)
MDYRPTAGEDSETDSAELVTASELREFVFCERAWWLNRQGYRVSRKAQASREAGVEFHEQRARAARTTSEGASLWVAIVLALAAIAIWLIRQLLETHH